MTPADAAARADRDAAATLARLDRERDPFPLVYSAMVLNRVPLRNDTNLLRRLLADCERDIYLESVAALGYDPMSERSQAAEKDGR